MAISVGCIGLGVMGARIAARLVQQGFPLMIYDGSSGPLRYFIMKMAAADIAATPAAMAEMCDVVITVLPNAAELRDVALGHIGLVHGFKSGGTVIDMGTSGGEEMKKLAAQLAPRGITLIEAPVCGTPMDAKAGKLLIPVAGDAEAIDRFMPVLQALGRVERVGALGSATAAAALSDYLRVASLLAACEALLLSRQAGMEPQALVALFGSSGLLSPVLAEALNDKIITRKFDSGRTLDTVLTDLDNALALARDAGLNLRFATLCHELWEAAHRERGSEEDYTAILRWLEANAPAPKPPAA
jgi:3-hydroxyisobutyrate dehydrogenase